MSAFNPGFVHVPVTPFGPDQAVDDGAFARQLDFHIRHGADALALPMHAGESVSLSDDEKRALLQFAIEHVAGRVPVIAHVSDAGTAIAADLARFAESAGAAAVAATPPYYWTPPAAMLIEHFAQIAAAVRLPFYVCNFPDEMPGTKITADLVFKLADRAKNLAGIIDASLDWQFMIELVSGIRRTHPNFQLITGNEYMVSAGAIGAAGMVSALCGVAPQLVRELYQLCRQQKLFEARAAQEQVAALRQSLKAGGIASLRAALRAMGRETGSPRAPLVELPHAACDTLAEEMASLTALRAEPRGW